MYSNTQHGMVAYNPYATHNQSYDVHLHAHSQPLYSYSQPGMQYPYRHPSEQSNDMGSYYVYTTVPFEPTPDELSRYEYNKTPSGQVVLTESQQTIEFFSGVANLPQLC